MKTGIRVIILLALFQLSADSCKEEASGCTDPLAINFNPEAGFSDGSCLYDPSSVSPSFSAQLDELLSETSGLIHWNGDLLTHNDHGPSELYCININDGTLKQTYSLGTGENMEWEEISQDEEFIYIGAFGNNFSGNRTDLHILRVEKEALISGHSVVDTIWYSYADQVDFNPSPANQTDFDCEAFVVSNDSIYLFTKQWVSDQTTVYSLPKLPGRYVAKKLITYPMEGMVTGATWVEGEQTVVLCGYTFLLQPFLYLLYDFDGNSFFSGNKRMVKLSIPFHQVEGIATQDGLKYYLSNEYFEMQYVGINPQKLHSVDLDEWLGGFLPAR